jgi:hypothetical protein
VLVGSGWSAGGLVVEGELAEEFAGGDVDDADVQVLDEQEDVGSGLGSADADVVQAAVVAEGDDAGAVDATAARTPPPLRPGSGPTARTP